MADTAAPPWLEKVLATAAERPWCTSPYCTTCGAGEFRVAVWSEAARQAGVGPGFRGFRELRDGLESMATDQRALLVRALIAGLRDVSGEWAGSEGIETILIDLDPPLLKHGVGVSLREELAGTPIGDFLEYRRSLTEAAAERRRAHEEYMRPEAIEERRARKRAERAAALARRLEEKRTRDRQRSAILARLASMSPGERLVAFARDRGLVLDMVPPELIPIDAIEHIEIDRMITAELVARIDRRHGPWGRLRRLLQTRDSTH